MIKDIVVNLGAAGNDSPGQFAISVAETFEAHVLGVAFAYEPVIPGTLMGGIPPDIIESQRAESEQIARTGIAHFEAAAKRAGLSYETQLARKGVSAAAEQIAGMARRFDLAVTGQVEPGKADFEDIVTEGLLFDSGRPVIVVPFIQKTGLKLDRVAVCWDGSRSAARAIGDAMPFLEKAKQVEVVIIASKDNKRDEIPGADLGQHLARHGIKVDVKRMTSPDVDPANTILSYASDSSADFLVMGGYGHSRLREFVLGGVTRGMLSSMTVPVLMSH